MTEIYRNLSGTTYYLFNIAIPWLVFTKEEIETGMRVTTRPPPNKHLEYEYILIDNALFYRKNGATELYLSKANSRVAPILKAIRDGEPVDNLILVPDDFIESLLK